MSATSLVFSSLVVPLVTLCLKFDGCCISMTSHLSHVAKIFFANWLSFRVYVQQPRYMNSTNRALKGKGSVIVCGVILPHAKMQQRQKSQWASFFSLMILMYNLHLDGSLPTGTATNPLDLKLSECLIIDPSR